MAEIPNVAKLTKEFGGVVFAGRLVDTHGVEVGNTREFLRPVAITTDNAATVAKNANDTTVFPMCFFVAI